MLALVVCGAAGRMGATVVRLMQASPQVKLAGAIDRPGSPRIGKDVGEVVGLGRLGVSLSDRIEPALEGDVTIIDFTNPKASLGYLRVAAAREVSIVIGTTGFSDSEIAEIRRLAERTRVVLSPNMSVGVNLLLDLVSRVARVLGDEYDVEIIEGHHRFKKDAPSGTALALGRAAAQVLKRDLEEAGVYGRRGMVGERSRKEIGFLSVRAGDIVGEHTVIFGGLGERVELVHRAHSRETFARGALRAAEWLVGQKKGLYTMQDVLGLQSF